jgi:hypothetical protein
MTFDYEAALLWPADRANPRLGIRFDADGRFLPEAGNTVVAQVVPGSPTEATLIDLRAALMALPVARHFAFTAVPSYHMTVFEGVIESRRTAEAWPADLPLDLPIDTATARMIDRLQGWSPLPGFAMQVTEATPFGLRLAGATAADEAMARRWRDTLSAALRLRTPHHDSYGFHITLAYAMTPLASADLPALRARMADLTASVRAALPVVHLARPAFCRFADMNAFPPVLAL